MQKLLVLGLTLVVLISYVLMQHVNTLATLQPGMTALHLPSGATAYLRRQAHFDHPAELYLSRSNDFCRPYDRWHDYKLADPIHGAADSPLLISYLGDTIIVHATKKPASPWFSAGGAYKVIFDPITPDRYAAYAMPAGKATDLPKGWQRIEVPFGRNTCSL